MRFANSLLIITRNCLNYNATRHFCVVAAKHEDATVSGKLEGVTERTQDNSNHQRLLNIAVIGVPNVGKSTFINSLINHRVCPTSSKVHTTRKSNKAIYTRGNTQLVLYDTPGLVTPREMKKHHLETSFRSAYRHAVQHADMISVVHDASNTWTRNELHFTVLDTLQTYSSLPSILILNKVDALKSKRVLLDLIRNLTNNTLTTATNSRRQRGKEGGKLETANSEYKAKSPDTKKKPVGWSKFTDVFLVSSVTGHGLSDVLDYYQNSAKLANWLHDREAFTDETPESLIVDSVRARLLDYLPQEIPYNLQCILEYYSLEKNTIYASVQVMCPSERIERLICGVSNGKLRQITERVTSDLVEMFAKPVSLTISTISKKLNK